MNLKKIYLFLKKWKSQKNLYIYIFFSNTKSMLKMHDALFMKHAGNSW